MGATLNKKKTVDMPEQLLWDYCDEKYEMTARNFGHIKGLICTPKKGCLHAANVNAPSGYSCIPCSNHRNKKEIKEDMDHIVQLREKQKREEYEARLQADVTRTREHNRELNEAKLGADIWPRRLKRELYMSNRGLVAKIHEKRKVSTKSYCEALYGPSLGGLSPECLYKIKPVPLTLNGQNGYPETVPNPDSYAWMVEKMRRKFINQRGISPEKSREVESFEGLHNVKGISGLARVNTSNKKREDPVILPNITTGNCVICLDAPSKCVFIICGHMCVCSKCSTLVVDCPICRKPSSTIIVYAS
jgi:hypothetical protein